MDNKGKKIIRTILGNTCRFILAAVFVFSGFIKANDPYGTVFKLQEYVAAFGLGSIPFLTLVIIAIMLAILEFSMGVHLLFGMSQVVISKIAVAFMTVMTLLTAYIWWSNPISDCGCFGDVLILSNEMTFAKNIVLFAMAIVNLKYNDMYIKIVGHNTRWLITLFCTMYIFLYSLICFYALPWMDFGPYRIGTNLRKSEARRATSGFYILDIESGEDLTDNIVEKDGYTFVVSIPNLQRADEGCVDLVNAIYEYSQDYGYAFYCVTTSTDKESQEYWRDHTGAEYNFYEGDASELRIAIRTAPGMMLLKNGIIIGKWSNYTLPDEERLTGRLQDIPIGQLHDVEGRKLIDWLEFFLLPLLLIILIDRIGSGFSWYRHWRQKSRKLQIDNISEHISHQINNPIGKNKEETH